VMAVVEAKVLPSAAKRATNVPTFLVPARALVKQKTKVAVSTKSVAPVLPPSQRSEEQADDDESDLLSSFLSSV
jgi:hypothetical protein